MYIIIAYDDEGSQRWSTKRGSIGSCPTLHLHYHISYYYYIVQTQQQYYKKRRESSMMRDEEFKKIRPIISGICVPLL